MTASYRRIATVTFQITGTDQTVTVNDIPYIWIPAVNPDINVEAAYAASDYLRSLGMDAPKSVLTITTSPAKEEGL